MHNISCKYFKKDNDDATDWVDEKIYSGRSVLHSVISYGINFQESVADCNPKNALVHSSEYIRRIIIFYDSNDVSVLTKEKYRHIDTMGANGDEDPGTGEGGNFFNVSPGKEVCINIPGDGILFEDGIVIRVHKSCLGVAVFASGGVV
jgi:hypothetical protein